MYRETHNINIPTYGFIYFIQGENGGAIKIGFTTDVVNRLKTLQTGFPDSLVVLYSFRGHMRDEQALHKLFAKHHIRGEWFKPVRQIFDTIEELKATEENPEKFKPMDIQFDDDGYLLWDNKPAIKTFISYHLPDCFTWSERGRINELTRYIENDQILSCKIGNHIRPLTIIKMSNILGMSNRQTLSLVKKMKFHKIVKEISFDSITYFVFNPLYGFKQKRLSLNVYMFFQEELCKVLPPWVIEKFSEFANELNPKFKVIK